jgi:hypothetical protein
MIEQIKTWFIIILKYGSPLFLILVPTLIIYGSYATWPLAENALSKFNADFKIQTGYHYAKGYNGTHHFENISRSYYLFKDSLIYVKAVMISVDEKGNIKIEENNETILPLVASYLFFMFVTWWFWIRKRI